MRVYRQIELNGFPSLVMSEEDVPRPQRGEILVRVESVALNYRDVLIADGKYTDLVAGRIPCSDASAVVVETGHEVRKLKPGDHVVSAFHANWLSGREPATVSAGYGNSYDGWLAEYKAVSQEAVVPAPSHLNGDQACTLTCAGATAWNALTGSRPVGPGDTVLTMGTGGVSIFAVQLAKRLGAGVIATTSSDEKRDFLLRLGADQTLNYTEDADWGASVKRLTGGAGVDRVVEVGGVGTFTNSLEAVARGGEVVLIGYLTGNDNRIEFARLRGSGAIMRPIAVGDRANLESLVRAISASKLVPVIDRTFPFEHATQAFERLRDRLHVGKIVIKVGGELA